MSDCSIWGSRKHQVAQSQTTSKNHSGLSWGWQQGPKFAAVVRQEGMGHKAGNSSLGDNVRSRRAKKRASSWALSSCIFLLIITCVCHPDRQCFISRSTFRFLLFAGVFFPWDHNMQWVCVQDITTRDTEMKKLTPLDSEKYTKSSSINTCYLAWSRRITETGSHSKARKAIWRGRPVS